MLRIFSFKRPHMRAFHFAWFSFFLAFFGWFALAPLQGKIKENNTPGESDWLTKDNFKSQNIIAVAGTIFMRLLVGPFCDRFGPRFAQSSLLGIFSLPVFLVGISKTYWQWVTARFFIGFIGATFVVTQFWTSIMFAPNIVGTANATSGGWGNLGGGVTNAIMPLIRKGLATRMSDDKSWRVAMVIPGTALVLTSIAMFFLSDDLPEGQYGDLIKAGTKEKTNPFKSMLGAATNWRVWILFTLYGGCFGIELVMNLNLANYFSSASEGFNLSESKAGLVAGLFGLMNIFARSLGGILSDFMSSKAGMRGRLWAFFIVYVCEGLMFFLFSRMRVIGAAIPVLIGFSLCVQMSEGATFGIVPFVDPTNLGAVSGIVGAGGNVGAVLGGLLINSNVEFGIADGFRNLGFIVMASSLLIALLWWPQYGSMFTKPTIASGKVLDDDEEEISEAVAEATEQ